METARWSKGVMWLVVMMRHDVSRFSTDSSLTTSPRMEYNTRSTTLSQNTYTLTRKSTMVLYTMYCKCINYCKTREYRKISHLTAFGQLPTFLSRESLHFPPPNPSVWYHSHSSQPQSKLLPQPVLPSTSVITLTNTLWYTAASCLSKKYSRFLTQAFMEVAFVLQPLTLPNVIFPPWIHLSQVIYLHFLLLVQCHFIT